MPGKIWLIDDNAEGSRELYGGSYVNHGAFSDILNSVQKLNEDSDLSFLKGAACVMYHDTLLDFREGEFHEDSHVAKEFVKEFIDNEAIPFVCSSDGHGSVGCFNNGNITKVKKSAFYFRLKFFLEEYRRSGSMNFHILAYGLQYQRIIMTSNALALLRRFATKRPEEILVFSDVLPPEKKDQFEKEEPYYLEEIVKFCQPDLGIDYKGIFDLIRNRKITVGHFRTQISNIIDSISTYGKNAYTWK